MSLKKLLYTLNFSLFTLVLTSHQAAAEWIELQAERDPHLWQAEKTAPLLTPILPRQTLPLLPPLQTPARRDPNTLPPKIQHAEPLFIDLIRDLGARQGEEEWNIGLGLTDRTQSDFYTFLVEYEWAPIDRLGLELELPFTFYSLNGLHGEGPGNRLDAIQAAMQYTFFVSPEWQTSMAIGYLNELELADFGDWGRNPFFKGNVYNPFFVAAKRWPFDLHTLIYTGPRFEQNFATGHWTNHFDINSNLHFMLPDSRNFIGIEINQSLGPDGFHTTLRPQMRLDIHEQLMLGLVVGIPLFREEERLSTFIRLIYEPQHIHLEELDQAEIY